MKKIVLSTILSAFGIALYAQPTLNATTNNPVAGETYYGHFVDTSGITKGTAGAAVTWNFSTAIQEGMDTTDYLSCASTPYCDSFSGSNIVMRIDGDYIYGVASSTGVTVTGGVSGGLLSHFTNPKDFISYPLTYNSYHLDTTEFKVAFDTMNIYLKIYDSSLCDAYGTLILPSGTYANALRVHTAEVTVDSLNIMGFPLVNSSRTDIYTWYVAGFHSPIMSITYDTAEGGMPYKSEAKYYTHTAPSTGVDRISARTGMELYPNPAANTIHARFDLADSKSAQITITDMMGRTVLTINSDELSAGRNDLSIPVADLANGTYLVRLHTASGVVSNKITISK